jgi:hypothetical protein
MELEQFYAFDVDEPLTPARRATIVKEIDDNAAAFGKDVTHSWHKREGEDFLRIHVEPVVIEVVFTGARIELYGAAPSWARLLFTASHKDQLRERIELVLIAAGFTDAEKLAAQRQPKRSLFSRARNKRAAG